MRRLPIYFFIDVSESMVGDPIEQVQDGIATIVKDLRTDPYALETVYVSIIAFAGKAKKLIAPIKDDTLVKIDLDKHFPAIIDDNFAVILAKCQTTERLYLIKYNRQAAHLFRLIGAFPIDNNYYELSEGRQAVGKVNTAELSGFPACPCCGNQFGFSTCNCGGIHCSNEERVQTCPWCGEQAEYSLGGGDIDVSRTRG